MAESTTEPTTEPTNEPVTEPTQEPTVEEPTFTQAQVDEMMKQRVAREKEKSDKAVEEAKKLAKMNADQKRDYELEKLKTENESLKAVQAHDEMKTEASKQFKDAGIGNVPDSVLEIAARDTAENTSDAIKTLTDWFNGAKEAAITELLKGKTPKVPGTTNTVMTKDEIMKINDPVKRQQLIRENSSLFM